MPEDAKLWSPDFPFLYTLKVMLKSGNKVLDQVNSYAAMRKYSTKRDVNGIVRLELNNQPLFQFGPLDQGWWPDGLYTAPTDEALVYDIQKTKDLGFNMIRKHIKVEPARWYTHCDQLGIIVWQDMPSGDRNPECRTANILKVRKKSVRRFLRLVTVKNGKKLWIVCILIHVSEHGFRSMRHGGNSRLRKLQNGLKNMIRPVW